MATSAMAGFAADYNLFYRTDGQSTIVRLNTGPAEAPGGDGYDLAGLQAGPGLEAHGLYGDPVFAVDPATVDADPSGFSVLATSPAVDHGTDLGYALDFAGKPIPAGAGPDIGAFELQPTQ